MTPQMQFEPFWSFGRMPEIIEVEFHSKYLSDFQLSRLVHWLRAWGEVFFEPKTNERY